MTVRFGELDCEHKFGFTVFGETKYTTLSCNHKAVNIVRCYVDLSDLVALARRFEKRIQLRP
jgi:hypothetical protein